MSELLQIGPEVFEQHLRARTEAEDPLLYIYKTLLVPRLEEMQKEHKKVLFVSGPLSPKLNLGLTFEGNWHALNDFTNAVTAVNPDALVISTTRMFSLEDEIAIRRFYSELEAHDAFSDFWEKYVLPSGLVTHLIIMPGSEQVSGGVRREVEVAGKYGISVIRPESTSLISLV